MEAPQSLPAQVSETIQGANPDSVESFSKALFPVLNASSLPEKLVSAIYTFISIHMNKDKTFEAATQEVQNKCKEFADLTEPIKQLFSEEAFLTKLKAKVMSTREMSRMNTESQDEQPTEIVDLDTYVPTPPPVRENSNRSRRRNQPNGVNEANRPVNGRPVGNN